MARRLSVQRQNEETKSAIRRVASLFASKPSSLAWLERLLQSHNLDPESGFLARLSETPEQDGNLFSGIWLTRSHEFWEFRAMVSRATGEVLDVECFDNITPSVNVSAHVQATGKSFGYLAFQVLQEMYGG